MSDVSHDVADRPSEAARLAAGVRRIEFGELPRAVPPIVERCFVDTVGVTIAGSTTGAGELASDMVRSQSGEAGPGTVIAGGRASLADAGFANGTAAHCLDYDDTSDAMTGHPSACLVPTILAVSEVAGASGEEAIAAYVAGFETEASLAGPINPGHYSRGWHATSTVGTFGATAAAGTILGLSEGELTHAFNIAASTAAGLKRNFGSMTKPMHVGGAVRSGITAALLASEGFTGATDAIGGRGGFLDLYGGTDAGTTCSIQPPGTGAAVLEHGIDVKKYPCCYFTQAAIDGVLGILDDHHVDSEAVQVVTVTASRGANDALAYQQPETGFEGKFSMEYTVAHAIVFGDVGLRAFDDDRLADSEVERMRERVDFRVDDGRPYPSYRTDVTIETDAGTYETVVENPPGHHDETITDSELREKFIICTGEHLNETAAATLFDQLSRTSDLSDVTRTLVPLR